MNRAPWSLASLLLVLPPAARADPPVDPVSVVEKQVVAYNARDIDRYLAFYAKDAELFEFPDRPLAKGTEAIRKRYLARFAEPNLHADITQRIALGSNVIDHEHIIRTFPEGPGTVDAVGIYEVRGGLITRVWFIIGAPKLDRPKK